MYFYDVIVIVTLNFFCDAVCVLSFPARELVLRAPRRDVVTAGLKPFTFFLYNGPSQPHSADMGRWRSLLNVWASSRRHSVVAPSELCVIVLGV